MLGRAMRTMPMDVRMLVHEGLTDKELKMMDYGAWDDKRKSTMTDEEIAADEAQTAADLKKVSGISGGDDFAGAVTPTEKIAGQRALDAESAKLSGSSNGGTSVINNNTTNNYGGGGKDTAIVTEKSATNSKLGPYVDDF